jgi:nicotinamide mononucleotide transporter
MILNRRFELLAVGFSLLYTILYTYGYIICFLFAFLSAACYLFICYQKKIYAEALLQLFYIFTAVYGYFHWTESAGELSPILPWAFHAGIIVSGTALVLVSGYLLRRLTDAQHPFVDSFTTVFSIFATLLMINLFPENWWYWVVIDTVSVWLYYQRGLYYTAVLFFIYTLLSINGLIQWQVY